MQSVLFSIRSKGLTKYLKRGQTILSRYGPTPSKMVRALDLFSQILDEFQCRATWPTTAVAIERNGPAMEKYVERGIELAIHGYRHIDHSQLALKEQVALLRRARDVFAAAGIPAAGFRSPYLQFNEDAHTAACEVGLAYVSNQPILWNVLDGESLSPAAHLAFERAIAFYAPWSASARASLPYLHGQLVEIPVSLPDDEILLDRLGGEGTGLAERAWSQILAETHQRGELFTLQLHPERIARCAFDLAAVLARARSLDPPVWIARLDEISAWWLARSKAIVTVADAGPGKLQLCLTGPEGMAFLVRDVQVVGPAQPWPQGYRRCETHNLILETPMRPFVGVPLDASPELIGFLQQHNYIVEASSHSDSYSVYLDQPDTAPEHERSLLARIEESDAPLVKLGRWPHNATSALAITGDIDALTLGDYGLRYLGH